MLTFRTFRNTDPPLIVGLLRSPAGGLEAMPQVSVDLLEELVFGKLYFDRRGLLLAYDGDRPVGFAHAGFGPDEGQDRVTRQYGVTCMIRVHPQADAESVAGGLLERCEAYLTACGAQVLYGGAIQPLNPFYLGLYGGSEMPGVLETDAVALEAFQTHGYRQIDQTQIFRREVSDFQVPMSRQLLQLRRTMNVEMVPDAATQSWWQACTLGSFDLTRFELHPRGGGQVLARALFRSMDPPMGGSSFVRQVGLIDLEVDASRRRQGLASFLLGEAFTMLARQGVTQVETQTMAQNTAALGLYAKLGLKGVGTGRVFRKE